MAPLRGLVLTWTDDGLPSNEVYNLGSSGLTSDEPFDLLGLPAGFTSDESFDLLGGAGLTSNEVFYFGAKAGFTSVETYDLLGAADVADILLPDGAPATIPYGWWQPESDGYEDLGTVVTD